MPDEVAGLGEGAQDGQIEAGLTPRSVASSDSA
jgi:hypothetical protein